MNGVQDITYRIYDNTEAKTGLAVSFLAEAERKRNGFYRDKVETARGKKTDKKAYDAYRSKNVPAYTPALNNPNPGKNSFAQEHYTGLLVLDIDDATQDQSKNRGILKTLPWIIEIGTSIGGDGLYAIGRCDPKRYAESYESAVRELRVLGINVPKGQQNPNRLRYVSYDPDLYFNGNPGAAPNVLITAVPKATAPAVKSENDQESIFKRIVEIKSNGVVQTGERHYFLIDVFTWCNKIGMSREFCHQMAERICRPILEDGDDYPIAAQVNNVYKLYKADHNTKAWENEPIVSTPKEDFADTDTPAAESYQDKFKRSVLDQFKDYPLPEPVVYILQKGEKIPLLTLKSFSLWQGKAKSRKTTLLALCIAAFIRDIIVTEETDFECAATGKVLFFDTEQGESYAARTMRLILKLADLSLCPNLIYCDLREYGPRERLKIIEAGIKCTQDVKLVVIDGIVDLMTDFMDAGEGHLSITNIIKLCSLYSIHIAGVLHQNKADKNARAHVGSISSQKCEMEISTEVDPSDRAQSLVTCVNSRGLPFEPFAIRWDKGSLPYICQDYAGEIAPGTRINRKIDTAIGIAETVFKAGAALSHTQAIKDLMELTLKSESTAKRFLKDLTGWNIVNQGADGNYRFNASRLKDMEP